MLINYREQRVAPLIAFLLVVPVIFFLLPLWVDRHLGGHHSQTGRVLMAAAMGVFYLFLIVRTLSFNARVRGDPRALQWDTLGLSLWQDGRSERMQWPQVDEVRVQKPSTPRYPTYLKIRTRKPDGRLERWSFPSGKLQLAGQSIDSIAAQIQSAREGQPVAHVVPRPVDPRLSNPRYEERLAKARVIVAIVMLVYFVTLVGMIAHLTSNTMLLTPHDPLLWASARTAFLITASAILLWYLKTLSDLWPISWRVASWFLGRVMVPGLTFSALMGAWAWLAANVYVTDRTWGGRVEHGAVLMVVDEPMITHRGRPNVEAHLMDRPGRDVFFVIDEADAELLRHWHDPGYIDEPACITVPVEWSGYAIRSTITTETPLPKGSLSTCS